MLFIKVSVLLVSMPIEADGNAHTNNKIRSAECIDFINESPALVTCGFVDLPADHDVSSSRTVSIPILIARQTRPMGLSKTGSSKKAILIPGGGGPGASMGFGYSGYSRGEYLEYFDSLRRAGFDIIIVDQRGAGLSKPVLRCTETTRDFKAGIVADIPLEIAVTSYQKAVAQCITRLIDQGINPADFDTYQSAKDFISIMESLPYTWWGTLATSYATAIAQAIETIKPAAFKRIVLDSPVPLDYQQPFTLESSIASMERLLTLCERTKRCNKKHSNIKQKFKTIVERAKDKPYKITIRVIDDNSQQSINKTLIIDDITLVDILINGSYSNYYLATIPHVIDQLHNAKLESLNELLEEYWYGNTDLDFAEGLSWTVHCKERQPLETDFLKRHPEYLNYYSPRSKLIMQYEQAICAAWNVGSTKLSTDNLFSPETLIISGDLDPVINADDVNNTVNDFNNSQAINMPGMGHSAWYQSACTRQNVSRFFAVDDKNFLFKKCNDVVTRFK